MEEYKHRDTNQPKQEGYEMGETIVVIGANHAGTAAINTVLDQFPANRVIAFDMNSNISFWEVRHGPLG